MWVLIYQINNKKYIFFKMILGVLILELKELSLNDGRDIFDMIKEIGPGENGFANGGYDISYEDFPQYLMRHINMAKGIDLKPEHVPQTMYWLYVNGIPVGIGKLRDYLNDNLKQAGGHIGYTTRPSERGKGYGKVILKELLKKAREKDLSDILLTCNENNVPSRKVIEANNGELKDIIESKCRYWIKIIN
jgi:predicted acetyltransferase